jgi:hypothetical protein
MTDDPAENAAAEAARRASAARADGRYADADEIERLGTDERGGLDLLHDWAMIEVDQEGVRSTRALGAPITRLKRSLVRLLVQYHGEQEAQISRFNLHLVGYVGALEDRIAELERRLADAEARERDT